MEIIKPNGKFKAVYNIYKKRLTVRYGDKLSQIEFEDIEEWGFINYNNDEDHPNYLHVQLDYDQCMQLLFYPRVEGDNELNEDYGTYYYSLEPDDVPDNLKLVRNDMEEMVALREFLDADIHEVRAFSELPSFILAKGKIIESYFEEVVRFSTLGGDSWKEFLEEGKPIHTGQTQVVYGSGRQK